MSVSDSRAVFLDATVLSNFASTDSITFLFDLLDEPKVVSAVRSELVAGTAAGHEYLEVAIAAIDSELQTVTVTEDVADTDIRDQLDSGEAASLLAAIEFCPRTTLPPVSWQPVETSR